MRTIESIQKGLQKHRPEDVAAGTGLSYGTVRRYAAGRAKRPSLETVRLLSEWLEKQEAAVGGVR